MEYLTQHIESLIFTTEHPISMEEIQSCLEETFEASFEVENLEEVIEDLKVRYQEEQFAFELVEIAKGFQFLTKGAYHQTVGTYLKQTTKKRLSRAAIETLSITAYKQPISKSELEKIRGVSCDYSIQKLLEKELVTILGRAETPGRPLLYGTTEKFMDYFGIKSLKDLPKPKDFKAPDSEVGEAAPIEEEVSAEVSTEAPAEIPAEGSAEVAEEEATDSPEISEETSAEVPVEGSTEVPEGDSAENPKEAPAEDTTEALVDVPAENKEAGISSADISIEDLDGAFEQEEE